MADEDRTFTTSEVEANRGREQGLGVGERELQAQHDPDGDADTGPAADEIVDEEALGRHESHKVSQGSKTRAHTKDTISRRV